MRNSTRVAGRVPQRQLPVINTLCEALARIAGNQAGNQAKGCRSGISHTRSPQPCLQKDTFKGAAPTAADPAKTKRVECNI